MHNAVAARHFKDPRTLTANWHFMVTYPTGKLLMPIKQSRIIYKTMTLTPLQEWQQKKVNIWTIFRPAKVIVVQMSPFETTNTKNVIYVIYDTQNPLNLDNLLAPDADCQPQAIALRTVCCCGPSGKHESRSLLRPLQKSQRRMAYHQRP